MVVRSISSVFGASSRRAGRGLRAAALLSAVVLVGCSSAASDTPSATTEPGGPVATAGPSQAAPGSPDVAITAITYSEDAASPLFAVVELGPNEAGYSRLDVYRAGDGRLSSVVGYGPQDLPTVIAFDLEGRPARMDASGYVAEFTYPSSDVEVVITAPDGTVVRDRGPLDLGAAVPARRTPNARLVSLMEEPPAPGMVRWPATFRSYSVFKLDVVSSGTNPGPWTRHVQFRDEGCRADSGMDCAAGIFGSLMTTGSPVKLYVVSYASTLDEPGSNDWVWRTRTDCESYTSEAEQLMSAAGWTLVGAGGAYQAVTFYIGSGFPLLSLGLYTAGFALTALRKPVASFAKLDCGSVPNLQKVEDEFLDRRSQKTVTITVTASGDCGTEPETGWRIKEPATQTITFEPFSPVYRSAFGAVPSSDLPDDQPVPRGAITQVDDLPVVGEIRFQAADCAVDMEGAFDLAATAAAVGMPTSDASLWAKLFTRNEIALDLKPTDGEPTRPIDVTGTFALTYEVPGGGYVEGYDNCVVTSAVTGTLEGKMTQVDGNRAKGSATIKMVPSLRDCPAGVFSTETRILENVAWSASGKDETALNGEIVFFTNPTTVDGPRASWLFKVNAKP